VPLDDARVPQFCIYEDPRLIAYYAPFDYLNSQPRVVLVGVTPGPTQMPAGQSGRAEVSESTRELQGDAP
jgi:hypothetical protein